MDRDDDTNQNGPITESTPNVALLNAAEVDMQVATAHKYPRSIKQFMADATDLVTLTDDVAESCNYALPRKVKDPETGRYVTKNIEGPSARFAEIILSCWGNARAGTRIVDEGEMFVTAQGFMFDLQKNVAIQVEVPRRIVDSQGRRFKVDMIGVTASAAASIALRNSILKVIPKALWHPIYEKAKATALGTEMTLSNKRLAALEWFQKKGVSKETIFKHFEIAGVEDITLEHIATLLGYKTALKEGDTTAESLFNTEDTASGEPRSMGDVAGRAKPVSAPVAPAADPLGRSAGAAANRDEGGPKVPEPDVLIERMKKAKTVDALDTHYAWSTAENYPDPAVRLRFDEHYTAFRAALEK